MRRHMHHDDRIASHRIGIESNPESRSQVTGHHVDVFGLSLLVLMRDLHEYERHKSPPVVSNRQCA